MGRSVSGNTFTPLQKVNRLFTMVASHTLFWVVTSLMKLSERLSLLGNVRKLSKLALLFKMLFM
ncbi:hypothetical protein RG47T_4075 [Mucilaginibacter polytrichastri]|uniref:Uncharacterized protein n=1 Tax=Mucilaginibacter polytrichastri TaxID=1302689 RepID=A0A1Q6A3L8_9SPHI|nr:hypothetical protein RG47T_4075 [Mucilaginibacter polytrichastri]